MQQHIPAWKRIGLKLKYAKDPYDPSTQQYRSADSEITGASNENHELDETTDLDHARPPKKRKLSPDSTIRSRLEATKSSEGQSLRTDPGETNVDAASGGESSSQEASREETEGIQNTLTGEIPRSRLQSRRKSVTFTPETKQDDGLTASSILKQQLSADQRTVESEGKSRENDSARTEAKSSHKSTTGKRPRESNPAWLEYLQQYSTDRQSWRFNKNKQTGLLKNLFDTHLIPPAYNPSIVDYVSGLQGGAAQYRLIESATSVLRAIAERDQEVDLDSMESEEARRAAYATALKRHMQLYERARTTTNNEYDQQQLAEMKSEMERGQRAEAVLAELLQKELYPERFQHAKPSLHQQRQQHRPEISVRNGEKRPEAAASTASSRKSELPKRKKRKIRTAAAEPNDSSSDSDIEIIKGPTTIREALRPISISPVPVANGKGRHIIFDDELLDKKFPKDKSYHEVAPKRKRGEKKARGFAYTHGTKDDESGSESDRDTRPG